MISNLQAQVNSFMKKNLKTQEMKTAPLPDTSTSNPNPFISSSLRALGRA